MLIQEMLIHLGKKLVPSEKLQAYIIVIEYVYIAYRIAIEYIYILQIEKKSGTNRHTNRENQTAHGDTNARGSRQGGSSGRREGEWWLLHEEALFREEGRGVVATARGGII